MNSIFPVSMFYINFSSCFDSTFSSTKPRFGSKRTNKCFICQFVQNVISLQVVSMLVMLALRIE